MVYNFSFFFFFFCERKFPELISLSFDSMDIDSGNLLLFSNDVPEDTSTEELSTALVQELINTIFSLPVERSNVGPLAVLPKPTTQIPREKHLPKPKEDTKWEKFAKEKGIKKRKRSRKLYDEKTDSYKYRWGKDSLAKSNEDWVYEHNAEKLGDYEDPFIQRKTEKRQFIEKQKKTELRNKRVSLRNSAKNEFGTDPSSLVVGNMAPTSQASKDRIKRAIKLAQRSTRSMGVHDQKRTDEPTIRKKKKYLSSNETDRKSVV